MTKIKTDYLKEAGTLNPRPEKVRDEKFLTNDFFDPHDLLQVRYELIRSHKNEKLAISDIAGIFGVTRLTVYRLIEAFEEKGLQGLMPKTRGPKEASKMKGVILSFIEQILETDPKATKEMLIKKVEDEYGVKVHRRTLERAIKKKKRSSGNM